MEKLRVTRKVLPGKPGAMKESKCYKDRLLAVRYKKDGCGRYVKTVEIIVNERHMDG